LSLNLEQKQAVVAEVSAEVSRAQAIVLAEYRGLAVGNMTELRKRARTQGIYLRVLKNTLARRAVAETPFKGLTEQMIGPLFYGISADPVAVAKVLHDFSRENVDKFMIRGGAMPNMLMTPQQVAELARMPSREQLLSTLLGTMQAPIAKLARTLNEVPAKFARTLAALQEQREKQAA
jgi:large subunit ribosomal protein L10